MKPLDLTDQTFGSLRVLERVPSIRTPNGRLESQWLCECECGNKVVVRSKNLVTNHTQSCGCRGKKEAEIMAEPPKPGRCFYIPHAINCDNNHKCSTCGWNPHNKELRNKRLMNLIRKDGTDE